MTYEKVKDLKPQEFKRLCGVRKETFAKMVELVETNEKQKIKTGRPSKLSPENQVLMTLEYLREYRTYFHIGQHWGLNESTVYRIIRKIENILIKSKELRIPGKKQLLKSGNPIEIAVIDVTETPLERPPKKQKKFYSGKKKKHTLKSQLIVEKNSKEIICIACGKGKEHDFKLFKRSKTNLKTEIQCLGDRGYQGIAKIHKQSRIPHKKPKKSKLSKEQKKENHKLASERIVIEHVYRRLKIFRILSERYRNRRKRFGLRFNLIAGIYNYELRLNSN
ncbi:IS5 family transposase [Lyngbya aestuarii]|uniref:IS5 family transposase n=1 Tax=Lyngbya aestuarii TaxID=118322 RepID=UPI00403DD491